MNNIAIIPARGGSKRIKRKNIRMFAGIPIIHYPLLAARDSGLFDEIHVSTDDVEIKSVVESLGLKVLFMRTSELANDDTGLNEVLKWVVREYEQRGRQFDNICCLLPCAPLITGEDLKDAFKVFTQHQDCERLLSVSHSPAPIEKALTLNKEGMLVPVNEEKMRLDSRMTSKVLFASGTFEFIRRDALLDGRATHWRKVLPYLLPRYKAIDIDEEEDFVMAEAIYLGQRVQHSCCA